MARVSRQEAIGLKKPAGERHVGGRLKHLDGLRGIASLVVVIHHVFLTSAVFGNLAESGGRPGMFSASWWFTYTPLHLFWGGSEAVFIFFVLSGYVLSAQMSRKSAAWPAYYTQRVPRLYLPCIASVLFALALATLVPRDAGSASSIWLNDHVGATVDSVLRDSLLLFGVDTLNSPLWSLQWEVWFSLLLPAYIWIAVKATSRLTLGVTVILALFLLMAVGSFTDIEALKYLPVFALGVLTHSYRGQLSCFADSMRRTSPVIWPSFVVLSVLFLMAYWMVQLHPATPDLIVSASHFPQIIGGWMIVYVVLNSPRAQVVLTRPWILWLGSRSFSLYLIHEPIVVSVALLLGEDPPLWQVLVLSLPLSLAVSEIFFRIIERPSHFFSRSLRLPKIPLQRRTLSGPKG